MTEVLSLPDAERLAERTLAAIDLALMLPDSARIRPHYRADRERVASDIAGLRRHARRAPRSAPDEPYCPTCCSLTPGNDLVYAAWPCAEAQDRSDGLRRTAALYGVAL